jgi:uncharacterized membrane protein HdeD (DUF308 family)
MSDIIFTQGPLKQFFSPWWLYLLFGLNLIFLSVLIILFPDLLSLIVSAFLMMDGVMLLVLAFAVLQINKKAEKHKSGKEEFIQNR